LLLPCNNSFDVKEIAEETAIGTEKSDFSSNKLIGQPIVTQTLADTDIFARSAHDENIGFSEEDRNFLSLMDKEFIRDCDGSWKAHLPFKKHRQKLPNNRPQALKRANILTNSLRKKRQEEATLHIVHGEDLQ
jgi:hypothetical protein